MDIGGDKPVDYLNIPAEANPFLGYRAVRIYEEYACVIYHTTTVDSPCLRSRQPENHDPDDLFNGRDLMGERKTGGSQTATAQ